MSKGYSKSADKEVLLEQEKLEAFLRAFLKACSDDLKKGVAMGTAPKKKRTKKVTTFIPKVLVYSKAKETAKTDFNLQTDIKIKEFMTDVGKENYYHYKSDQLDNVLMSVIPKGYSFEVFYFTWKSVKDSYLAIIHYVNLQSKKDFWLIKSLAKNDTEVFKGSFADQLQSIKKDLK